MKVIAAPALLLSFLCAGCGLFGSAVSEPRGPTIAGPYAGMPDKSVAIVIYAPAATLDEYAGAREEISAFLTAKFHEHLPTTRLVDPADVINWQDSTLNWMALSQHDMGTHFSVDRVLFIELLDYSTQPILKPGNMQGHMRAQVHVTNAESDATDPSPAWTGTIDVSWPPDRPLDPTQTNDDAVRARLLDVFADRLVQCFYQQQE